MPRLVANTRSLLIALIFGLGTSCRASLHERATSTTVMGTELQLVVRGADASLLEEALRAVVSELQRVENLMTDWRPSELARLNASAGTGPLEIDSELHALLVRAQELSRVTRGAFDVTYAGVGELWDFSVGATPRVPTASEVATKIKNVGFERLQLVAPNRAQLPAGMRIGLGGVAKGYGVDRARAVLESFGIEHALIKAGGDIALLGEKHAGAPWRVALVDPRAPERGLARLALRGHKAVSTSGDSERYFELDGQRYHHIIDPRSGYPATGARSATIICEFSERADALATAMCVLGPVAGLAVIQELETRGERIAAFIIDADGVLHASARSAEFVSSDE
ncbi:MAG: FAD:protein FMN transferase [Planctomycetota bacterium]